MHSHIYVRLGNISILYKSKFIKIKKHPYYIALKTKNKELYENFIFNLNNRQIKKPSGNWEGLQSLLTSIKKDGFDIYNGSFRLVSNNDKIYSRHGRHRLCILLYLYGSKLKLKLRKHKDYCKIIKLIN
jgi:hypothetical protein